MSVGKKIKRTKENREKSNVLTKTRERKKNIYL